MNSNTPSYRIEKRGQSIWLAPIGAWRIQQLTHIYEEIEALLTSSAEAAAPPAIPLVRALTVDGSELQALDTSGAWLLLKLTVAVGGNTSALSAENLRPEHESILRLVLEECKFCNAETRTKHIPILEHVGRGAFAFYHHLSELLAFVGETIQEWLRMFYRPNLIRIREFFVQLEQVCLHAIPICALVTFLIGVVVAYLFAGQIERYGANIFIVDGVSISMCREMSPIIVAIIMAGRSGSAFTAQIGTMKLNEEIDAIQTLGLSPMRVLVFPRLLALVLAMPLLVFVGDVIGILGGAVIANIKLGITYHTFYERLQVVLKLRSVFVGLVKAPVFAAFIAVIGCRMGLSVENNARSVGEHTTSTVVQSIVSVILLNAAFAVIFVELGI